jgi:hypothetical protein
MIRNLAPEDRPQIEAWIAAEPTHASNTFDWYSEARTSAVVFEDSNGQVLVAKFTPCLRVDIDFNPEAGPSRVGKALVEGLAETATNARNQGFKEFVFESRSPKLTSFCERLGYSESPDYRKNIRE